MKAPATLVVLPDAVRVEHELLRRGRAGALVDARTLCALAQLVRRCLAVGQRSPEASEAVAHAAVWSAALASDDARLQRGARQAHFASMLDGALGQLAMQAVTPDLLQQAGRRAGGSAGHHAEAVAQVWRARDAQLASQGLRHASTALAEASTVLDGQGLPPEWTQLATLEVAWVHDLFPARLRLLQALAGACQRQGTAFQLTWPGVGRDEVDVFVAQAIATVEATWSIDGVSLQLAEAPGPARWVAEQAFSDAPRVSVAPTVTAFEAVTPRDELAEVAARVKQLVDAGHSPERLAVVVRGLPGHHGLVQAALAAVSVPARVAEAVALSATAAGRLALNLARLDDDQLPAPDVVRWLTSPAVSAAVRCDVDVAGWLAEAGVRDDSTGAEGGRGAYSVRLGALQQRLVQQAERSSHPRWARKSAEVKRLTESVSALQSLARRVPRQGPLSTLLDAWWQAVLAAGLVTPVTATLEAYQGTPLQRLETTALARDGAAAAALEAWHRDTAQALEHARAGQTPMTRPAFSQWLSAQLEHATLRRPGARAGAVWVLDAANVPGCDFDAVFVVQLNEGVFPRSPPTLELFSDTEQRALNRAAGRPLFCGAAVEHDVRLPLSVAEDRLLFHHALSSATGQVTLSRSRVEASGREVLPSPFLEAVGRAVHGFSVERVSRLPVASVDRVASPAEWRRRVLLETCSPQETRQSRRDARHEVLRRTSSAAPWFLSAEAVGRVELGRLEYFSSEVLPPQAFTGDLAAAPPPLLRALTHFDAAHPVSASRLQALANCGFQALARDGLKLAIDEGADEELDPRGQGTFWHEVLRRSLDAVGAQPGPATEAVVATAVARAVEAVAARQATGHPRVWLLAQARATAVIRRLLGSDAMRPFEGLKPAGAEVGFGQPSSAGAWREARLPAVFAAEEDVFFRGTIDRLDEASGRLAIIDYKSSTSGTAGEHADELLEPDFQLPLYALAAAQARPGTSVDAAWVGIKRTDAVRLSEVAAKAGGTLAGLLATDAETRGALRDAGAPNLANAVFSLLARRRGGDFGPRAVSCERCDFHPVCRISSRRLRDDVPGSPAQ